jgi:hypothetical protein
VDPLTVICGAFEVLWEKLDPGEFEKVMQHLPPLRDDRDFPGTKAGSPQGGQKVPARPPRSRSMSAT